MFVIAMDGPAGSGKSSAASLLAKRLGYIHADSGAIYRTLTLALIQELGAGASPEEFDLMFQKKGQVQFDKLGCDVVIENGKQVNRIKGVDVQDRIRTPQVTARIRFIADREDARSEVNRLLREFSLQSSLVVDGRDIGTVVFPDASWKFFIEASVDIRAERRYLELMERGIQNIDRQAITKEIQKRDDEDRTRKVGALKQADDAILIDTSTLSLDGVIVKILSCIIKETRHS